MIFAFLQFIYTVLAFFSSHAFNTFYTSNGAFFLALKYHQIIKSNAHYQKTIKIAVCCEINAFVFYRTPHSLSNYCNPCNLQTNIATYRSRAISLSNYSNPCNLQTNIATYRSRAITTPYLNTYTSRQTLATKRYFVLPTMGCAINASALYHALHSFLDHHNLINYHTNTAMYKSRAITKPSIRQTILFILFNTSRHQILKRNNYQYQSKIRQRILHDGTFHRQNTQSTTRQIVENTKTYHDPSSLKQQTPI
jgi:hypothetical protein